MDLKVLQVIQFPLDYRGGPAVYVRELSKHLAKLGVEVGILHPEGSNEFDLGPVKLFSLKSRLPRLIQKDPWIFSFIAHKHISVLQREFDIVHVHLAPVILQLIAGSFRKPLVSTIHGWPLYEDYLSVVQGQSAYSLMKLVAVTPREIKAILKLVDRSKSVATVSEYLKRILERYNPLWSGKIKVLYGGVDTNFFYPRNGHGIPDLNKYYSELFEKMRSKLTIFFMARVIPRKGADLLLEAVSELEEKVQIVVAGKIDPAYELKLKNLASSLGIEDMVTITGEVPIELLPYLYSIADVYVLPSMFETLGITLLEAMACGTPVVATRVGGIPEIVDHGRNGLLVRRDPEELRRALEYLLNDELLRRRMSLEAVKTVRERFSWNAVSKRYVEFYRRSLED